MVLFYDTFHRRPRMASHLRAALNQVKTWVDSRVPIDVDQLARQVGHEWRDRTLTPAVTVRLFLLQVLNGNMAMTGLRLLSGMAVQASSYCEARMRLPLALFAELFDAVCRLGAREKVSWGTSLLNGRRVLLADASSFSMPDTPVLRKHFGYPPGQRDGLGFPVAKLLGVIDAISGAFVCAMGCPLFTHEAREMLTLHPLLRRSDVLIGDRALCSYAQIALLMQRGVDVVLRLHQRRPMRALADHIELWTRPPQRPTWMSLATWDALPQQIRVRIVRCVINRKNCRTRIVYIATSLLDARAYPHETIMRLYGYRWQIETCFNQLKTHAKMNTLKSKTVEGVIKELIMYLMVWNLVRMTMQQFARRVKVSVWRVSFTDALRWLSMLLLGPRPTELKLLLNPDRPDRWEPRKLKRRLNEYDLLTEPRQRLKAKWSARYEASA
jgi:hypothetical protein